MQEVRAVVGVNVLPDGEEDAQRALDKFKNGEWPTAAERQALDLVIRMLRPAVRSRAGVLDPLPDHAGADPAFRDAWPAFTAAARDWLPSIGRIDDRASRHIGTGFLVEPDVVATNQHVLDVLSFGSNELVPESATIDFGWEYRTPNKADSIPLVGVRGFDERLDLALLELAHAVDHPVVPLRTTDVHERD